MLEYLTSDWVDAVNAHVEADDALSSAAADSDLTLQQVVTDTRSGTFEYVVRLRAGACSVKTGRATTADVTLTQSYSTAVGIYSGSANALAEFQSGHVEVSGNSGILRIHRDVLALLQRSFDAVKAGTVLDQGRPTPAMPRNVVLTGFMGTGKSTVGRELAHQLSFEFVDTDQVLEARFGSIPDIFEAGGEDEFRRLERDIVAEVAERSRCVIATGGGTLLDQANVEALRAGAAIFCLTAPLADILARVGRSAARKPRPLLATDDLASRVAELLADREHAYSQFTQIDASGMSPSGVARLIAVKAAMSAQQDLDT